MRSFFLALLFGISLISFKLYASGTYGIISGANNYYGDGSENGAITGGSDVMMQGPEKPEDAIAPEVEEPLDTPLYGEPMDTPTATAPAACDISRLVYVCNYFWPSRGYPDGDWTCEYNTHCSVPAGVGEVCIQQGGELMCVDLTNCASEEYSLDCSLLGN